MPWFARINDKEEGPYTSSELKNLVASGTVSLEHMVRQDDGDWVKASSVPGLNEIQWLIKSGDAVSGPYNSATIAEFATLGVITPDTQIKQTTHTKWRLAAEVRGLAFRPEEMLEDEEVPKQVPPPLPKQATFDAIEHHSIDPISETKQEPVRSKEQFNQAERISTPTQEPVRGREYSNQAERPFVIPQMQIGNSGLSTAGLIFSCLGWLTCGLLSPVGAFLCFLGLFARGSKSHAVAGLIVGFPGVIFLLTFGLGFLGIFGILGIGVTSSFEKAKVSTAKASLSTLANCVKEYQIEIGNGKFPQSLEALVSRPTDVEEGVWFPKLEKLPNDPWSNPFKYTIVGDSFLISSNGPDGVAGTSDDLSEPSLPASEKLKSESNLQTSNSTSSASDSKGKDELDGTDKTRQLSNLAIGEFTRVGDYEIGISKVSFRKVNLRNRFSGKTSTSQDELLQLRLTVKNHSDGEILNFRTGKVLRDNIGLLSLSDDVGNNVPQIEFDVDTTVVGGDEFAYRIKPGSSITHIVVFDEPLLNAEFLVAKVSLEAIGEKGFVEVKIHRPQYDPYYRTPEQLLKDRELSDAERKKKQATLAAQLAEEERELDRLYELEQAEKEQKRKEDEAKQRKENNRKIIDAMDYRYWSSKDGKFFVTADLVRINETTVTLKRIDNDKEIEVQIEKLSEEATEYINSLR